LQKKTSQELKGASNGKNSVFHSQSHRFEGPVPDPESLQKYEAIQAGFANRLITMAEKEQEARHSFINNGMKHEFRYNYISITIAFIITIAGLSVCAYGYSLGYATESTALISVGIVSIVGAFMWNKKKQPKQEDQEKK
jgi:uncharacterized membrane protein